MSEMEERLKQVLATKEDADIHKLKIRVRVTNIEKKEEAKVHDWPLDHPFYVSYKGEDGEETVYALYPLCPHGVDMGWGCERCFPGVD